jgi:hypothetical protein
MANANTPYGLRPVGNFDGHRMRDPSVPTRCRRAMATAIMIGDPVKLVGTGQTINGEVYADIARAATGDVIVGVASRSSRSRAKVDDLPRGVGPAHRQGGG